MQTLIRKHPVASYLLLAFALSWLGILAVIRGGAIPAPPDEAQRLFAMVYLAMLVGPSVAGITITSVTGGTRALREFRDRLLKWRVPGRWYAAALLTAPLTLIAVIMLLSVTSADFVPGIVGGGGGGGVLFESGSRASFLLLGLLVGVGAGFFEELGWTGVAIPKMRARYGAVMTGLLLGLVWGAWHFLAILWGSGSSFGSIPITLFMVVALFAFLPPYRVLMVWVYDRTQSLFVAVLMHTSLTASMLILGPAVVGGALVAYDLVFGALLWALVALVTWTRRGRLSPRKVTLAQPIIGDVT